MLGRRADGMVFNSRCAKSPFRFLIQKSTIPDPMKVRKSSQTAIRRVQVRTGELNCQRPKFRGSNEVVYCINFIGIELTSGEVHALANQLASLLNFELGHRDA
jgi:hypothetical protein